MANRSPPDPRARRQLDRKLAPLRAAEGLARPPRGWVRAIRDALGMTTRQLGDRLGVGPSTITALEQSELRDAVSLATLRAAAEAMGCRLVYAMVPDPGLEDTVYQRAMRLADAQLARSSHTMVLENQGLAAEDLAAERTRLVEDLLRGDPRRLWDAP